MLTAARAATETTAAVTAPVHGHRYDRINSATTRRRSESRSR
ncbi:hypothetical protein NJ7G_2761 [Natrinema sp. J7-2]|nr:hypothetical protein NJ7G_2761 [Natrinema sp. J7-2]